MELLSAVGRELPVVFPVHPRTRKMLGDAGANVKIHTVRGVGYLMAEEKAG